MKFYDSRHAGMRLNESLVMYKGEPIFVRCVNEDWSVEYIDLRQGEHKRIADLRRCKTLSLKPVDLGFCNNGGSAVYLMRAPTRRYKQGLNTGNIHGVDTEGRPLRARIGTGLLVGSEMRDTIVNIYPSFEDTLNRINNLTFADVLGRVRFKSQAFHRNWALSFKTRDFDDDIKGTDKVPVSRILVSHKYLGVVGAVVDGGIRLSTEWEYLNETLEEEVLHV